MEVQGILDDAGAYQGHVKPCKCQWAVLSASPRERVIKVSAGGHVDVTLWDDEQIWTNWKKDGGWPTQSPQPIGSYADERDERINGKEGHGCERW